MSLAVAMVTLPEDERGGTAVILLHGYGALGDNLSSLAQSLQRLPFSGAERLKAELEQRGFSVTFEPFSGGHEIPSAVVSELQRFLFD